MRNYLVAKYTDKYIDMNTRNDKEYNASLLPVKINHIATIFNKPYLPGTYLYFHLLLQFSSFHVFRLIRPLPQSFREDHNRL